MSGTDTIAIAIIDDSQILRTLLSRYLSGQGFDIVLEAESGVQLLGALDAGMPLPDMCLLDTNMPGMNGFETARRMKAQYPSVLLMAYSYFDDDGSIAEFLSCGAHGYTSKDAAAEELRDALRLLYESQRS